MATLILWVSLLNLQHNFPVMCLLLFCCFIFMLFLVPLSSESFIFIVFQLVLSFALLILLLLLLLPSGLPHMIILRDSLITQPCHCFGMCFAQKCVCHAIQYWSSEMYANTHLIPEIFCFIHLTSNTHDDIPNTHTHPNIFLLHTHTHTHKHLKNTERLQIYTCMYIYIYMLWCYYLGQVWPFEVLLSGPSLLFTKHCLSKNTIKWGFQHIFFW